MAHVPLQNRLLHLLRLLPAPVSINSHSAAPSHPRRARNCITHAICRPSPLTRADVTCPDQHACMELHAHRAIRGRDVQCQPHISKRPGPHSSSLCWECHQSPSVYELVFRSSLLFRLYNSASIQKPEHISPMQDR